MFTRRKIVCWALAVLLTECLILTGYAKEKTSKRLPPNMIMASGPTGGSTYLQAVYWGSQLEKEYGIKVTAVAGTSEGNISRMLSKEIEVGMCVGPSAVDAFWGTAYYAGKKKAPLRLIDAGMAIPHYTISLRESGISSYGQFPGKRVAYKYKGAFYQEEVSKAIFKFYGINEAKIISLPFSDYGEAHEYLKNRDADVISLMGLLGTAPTVELFQTYNCVMIPMSEECSKTVFAKFPWARPFTLPVGIYKGLDKPIQTVTTSIYWVCHKDLPDEIVYSLLKYFYDDAFREDFLQVHSTSKRMTIKTACTEFGMPYHFGAVKFFKDKGVWTSELEKHQKKMLEQGGETE